MFNLPEEERDGYSHTPDTGESYELGRRCTCDSEQFQTTGCEVCG